MKKTMIFKAIFLLVFSMNVQANAQLSSERLSIQTLEEQQKMKTMERYYADLDDDGVLARFDQCPNSEFEVPVNTYGCQLDTDKDGIYDHQDACPNTPLKRPVNFIGCEADTDGDGVLDFDDLCPGTPLGTYVDKTGCVPPVIIPRSFVISHIIFDTGSYGINDSQKPILDNDAAHIKELTETDVLLVTGFTDDVGSPESNVKLSWNRAQTVKDYLVNNFRIPADKIYILGLGEGNPMTSNDTPEGKQQNRRIEFQLITLDEQVPDEAVLIIPEGMKGYQRFRFRF